MFAVASVCVAVLVSFRYLGGRQQSHGVVPRDHGRAVSSLRVSERNQGTHVTGGVRLLELGEQLPHQVVLGLVQGGVVLPLLRQLLFSFEIRDFPEYELEKGLSANSRAAGIESLNSPDSEGCM